MTRNKKPVAVEDEGIVALKEQTVVKDSTGKTNEEVTDAISQRREKQIMVVEKEIKDKEKEIEVGKDKEKKEKQKVEKNKDEEKCRSEKAREKRKEKASEEGPHLGNHETQLRTRKWRTHEQR